MLDGEAARLRKGLFEERLMDRPAEEEDCAPDGCCCPASRDEVSRRPSAFTHTQAGIRAEAEDMKHDNPAHMTQQRRQLDEWTAGNACNACNAACNAGPGRHSCPTALAGLPGMRRGGRRGGRQGRPWRGRQDACGGLRCRNSDCVE